MNSRTWDFAGHGTGCEVYELSGPLSRLFPVQGGREVVFGEAVQSRLYRLYGETHAWFIWASTIMTGVGRGLFVLLTHDEFTFHGYRHWEGSVSVDY